MIFSFSGSRQLQISNRSFNPNACSASSPKVTGQFKPAAVCLSARLKAL